MSKNRSVATFVLWEIGVGGGISSSRRQWNPSPPNVLQWAKRKDEISCPKMSFGIKCIRMAEICRNAESLWILIAFIANGEVMRSLNIVDHSFPLILNNPLRNPGLVLECIRNKVMQQHLGVFQGKLNYSILFRFRLSQWWWIYSWMIPIFSATPLPNDDGKDGNTMKYHWSLPGPFCISQLL